MAPTRIIPEKARGPRTNRGRGIANGVNNHKYLVTAAVLASEIARRTEAPGALVGALPLVTPPARIRLENTSRQARLPTSPRNAAVEPSQCCRKC